MQPRTEVPVASIGRVVPKIPIPLRNLDLVCVSTRSGWEDGACACNLLPHKDDWGTGLSIPGPIYYGTSNACPMRAPVVGYSLACLKEPSHDRVGRSTTSTDRQCPTPDSTMASTRRASISIVYKPGLRSSLRHTTRYGFQGAGSSLNPKSKLNSSLDSSWIESRVTTPFGVAQTRMLAMLPQVCYP